MEMSTFWSAVQFGLAFAFGTFIACAVVTVLLIGLVYISDYVSMPENNSDSEKKNLP